MISGFINIQGSFRKISRILVKMSIFLCDKLLRRKITDRNKLMLIGTALWLKAITKIFHCEFLQFKFFQEPKIGHQRAVKVKF